MKRLAGLSLDELRALVERSVVNVRLLGRDGQTVAILSARAYDLLEGGYVMHVDHLPVTVFGWKLEGVQADRSKASVDLDRMLERARGGANAADTQ